jgi:flagellar motor switch protein FliG
MKSIFDMTGTERAAALLVLLGSEIASEVMKHLDEESIEAVTAQMIKVQNLSQEDREDLIGEFMIELKKASKTPGGGINRARKMMIDAFGAERADEMITRIESKDPESGLKFLAEIDDADALTLLKDEEPGVLSLVLSYIEPAKAAKILKELPEDKSRAVAIKLAKMKNPSPEAAVAVAKALKKRYKKIKDLQGDKGVEGGVDSLMSILAHMSSSQEKNILKDIDITLPHLSREIMERIFVFENVIKLSNNEMRILIDEINNDEAIAKALKGAGDDVRFKFMRNMSQNRASDIIREMDLMGPVRLSEIEECRDYIVEIMRELNENGVIVMKRDGEIFVE